MMWESRSALVMISVQNFSSADLRESTRATGLPSTKKMCFRSPYRSVPLMSMYEIHRVIASFLPACSFHDSVAFTDVQPRIRDYCSRM